MLDLQSKLAPSLAPARPTRRGALEDTGELGLKLVGASVQGLDQLRKLVLPDALLGAIGGAIPGNNVVAKGFRSRRNQQVEQHQPSLSSSNSKKEEMAKEALREQLDDLLASSCVLCEGAVASVDRGFVDEGEEM